MTHTIGTCSLCGGRVVLHEHWMSVNPQIPHCESCGARAAEPHGPVIPMEPPARDWPPQPDEALDGLWRFQHPFKAPTVYDPLRTYRQS